MTRRLRAFVAMALLALHGLQGSVAAFPARSSVAEAALCARPTGESSYKSDSVTGSCSQEGSQQNTAGNIADLRAEGEIAVLAAHSSAEQHSSQRSSSAGVGVANDLSVGAAVGVTVSASAARGQADGADVTHANSHVTAGNTARLQSAGDTTIAGAGAITPK